MDYTNFCNEVYLLTFNSLFAKLDQDKNKRESFNLHQTTCESLVDLTAFTRMNLAPIHAVNKIFTYLSC